VTRHIANPRGLADLARIVAELSPCDECDGTGEVRWLEDPPDPQTETAAPCPSCMFETAGLAYRDRPSDRERAYELARTHLAKKSPDTADTVRGATTTDRRSA
jgi:hypothetical protein